MDSLNLNLTGRLDQREWFRPGGGASEHGKERYSWSV